MAGGIDMVTVSRSFGSGGGELARRLAEATGWRLVEREIVREVADRLRIPEEEVEARDEQVPGLAERVGRYLADAFPELMVPPLPPPRVDDDAVRVVVEAILREAARHPPVIVVGHGAQCLFRDRPGTLHVRVDAPVDARLDAVVQRTRLDREAARREIQRRDAERREYLRRHYGVDWSDPLLYGVWINTGAVGVEAAAAAVMALVRGG